MISVKSDKRRDESRTIGLRESHQRLMDFAVAGRLHAIGHRTSIETLQSLHAESRTLTRPTRSA